MRSRMTQPFWGEYKMREVGMTGRGRRRGKALALLLATASLGTALTPVFPSYAQTVASYSFAIPSQPLPAALAAFSRVTGLGIVGAAGLPDGLVSTPVNGTLDAATALSQLLSGTGLNGAVNSNTATIAGGDSGLPVADDGSIVLEEVNVNAWVEAPEPAGTARRKPSTPRPARSRISRQKPSAGSPARARATSSSRQPASSLRPTTTAPPSTSTSAACRARTA